MERVTHASKRRRDVSCRTQGGLSSAAHRPCFFWMSFVVACLAQAHQIVVYVGEFRVLIYMLDVMNDDRRDGFSISCAPPATVSVAPLYEFRFSFPFLAVVIKIHCRTFNKNTPPRQRDNEGFGHLYVELLPAPGRAMEDRAAPGLLRPKATQKGTSSPAGAGALQLCFLSVYHRFFKKTSSLFTLFQASEIPYLASVKSRTAWSFIWYTLLCST